MKRDSDLEIKIKERIQKRMREVHNNEEISSISGIKTITNDDDDP